MGNFRQFYDNPIQFVAWYKDGTIVVAINGKRYMYATDTLYHRELKKVAKYKPGKALNMLKDWVAKGWAQQISPPPNPPEPPKPTQRTLF